MEIPEINFLTDFQAGVNCLQNPSIINRLFTLFSMEIYSLWKWSAVIIAVFTAFKKLKLLFIRFRGKVTPSLEHFVEHLVYDFELTDNEDDDESETSSISSLEDFSEEESEVSTSSYDDEGQNGNYSRMGDRRLSWTDFTTGSSVVKLWDGFEESYKNIVSIWDSKTFFDFDWGSSEYQEYDEVVAQPNLTAEVNLKRNGVVLSAYDRRVRDGKPAVFADWAEPANGVEKVYVRNGINGVLTVGDLRNIKTPLKTVRLRRTNGDAFGNAD